MTSSAIGRRQAARDGSAADRPAAVRPVAVTAAIAACAAAATGLAVLTLLVLAAWIAAPHAAPRTGLGLPGVLRAAAVLWLIGHHVGFALRGAGRIGMLPLGLVLLPGALLWRAGRWAVRSAALTRLRQAGYAALAMAVPYGLLAGVLALAGRSATAAPSLLQAVTAGFLLALTAGGLGAARALAPWAQLAALLPARLRSVIAGTTGALAVLWAAGAALAAVRIGAHMPALSSASAALAPGAVGGGLLLLAQLAYVPNAVIWAIAFILGPGFAFGAGTMVAPTGSALGALPNIPILASLPAAAHAALPAWLSVPLLALPFLAGGCGGLLLARAAPTLVLEAAAMWGFGAGALAGGLLGALAAFAGGPLGDGRLAEVGPSGWQVGTVAALEIGVAAAMAAGAANWLRVRGRLAGGRSEAARGDSAWPAARHGPAAGTAAQEAGHIIYVDPWAGEPPRPAQAAGRGPSALP